MYFFSLNFSFIVGGCVEKKDEMDKNLLLAEINTLKNTIQFKENRKLSSEKEVRLLILCEYYLQPISISR